MKTEKAVFGMGCFWGPQAFFDEMHGVLNTRVGYAGGTKEDPTYHNIGDHLEAVEVTFDPATVGYEDLLKRFWAGHDSTYDSPSQYRSAIFYTTAGQEKTARQSLADARERSPRAVQTRLEPLDRFYEAEEYHQKFYEKCRLG